MTTATGEFGDIVNNFRAARAQLRLDKYDRYLVEHIAARVSLLLGNCGTENRGGANQGVASVPSRRRNFVRSPTGARASE